MKRFATNLSKTEQKYSINSVLAKNGNRCGVAVVLDGSRRNTTKALVKKGWRTQDIFIPNNSKDYAYIKRYHENTYKISLRKFLLENSSRKFRIGCIYMDYMCTLDGCKTATQPKNDLGILFNNQMLMDNSALGVTFNFNRINKKDNGFSNPEMVDAISLITSLAYSNGYVAILLNECGGHYNNNGSNMFSFVFKVYRINAASGKK